VVVVFEHDRISVERKIGLNTRMNDLFSVFARLFSLPLTSILDQNLSIRITCPEERLREVEAAAGRYMLSDFVAEGEDGIFISLA
jgi:hypothetical protein